MPSFHSRNVGWASKTLLELVSRCLLPPVTCRPAHLTLLERPRAPPPPGPWRDPPQAAGLALRSRLQGGPCTWPGMSSMQTDDAGIAQGRLWWAGPQDSPK